MSDVTPEELAAIRERANAATQPWSDRMLRMSDDAAEAKFGARPNGTKSLGDGSQDVPRLLDALQTAEADRDALARKIAAAPHAYGSCGLFGEKCHCWKADTGDAAHQGHDGAAS